MLVLIIQFQRTLPNDDVIRLYNDEQRKMFKFINGYFISSLHSNSSIIHNIVFQQDNTNIFALPYTPLNISYSNVHQMRSCGLIKRNVFAIELHIINVNKCYI
jgi:hypothetical protein